MAILQATSFSGSVDIDTLRLDGESLTKADIQGFKEVDTRITASAGNQIIGTDSDINTSGATIIDNLYMTDGVITSHGTRVLTLANLGYTGATNANYITNTNQLTNGAGFLTITNDRNYITDSRGDQRAPSYYDDRYAQWDFQSSSDTTAGGDAWHSLLTVSKWSSYNASHKQEQLLFTGDDLKRRTATSDTAWGTIKTIYDSGNLTLGTLGYTGATNANYITNNNQLTNGASYLTTSGKAADSEKVDGINGASLLRSDADDSFSGGLVSTARDEGIFGTYDSTKTDHIWSMGSAYKNHSSGTNFGNIYGLAYKHTNNTTGGTMGGGHQMVWATNGSPKGAIGETGIWSSTRLTIGGTMNNTGCYSSILGGSYNTISNGCSTIVGGKYNTTYSCYSVIGGGCTNYSAHGKFNTIAGGYGNCISPTSTTEGDTISGGIHNKICYSSTSCYNTIAGGNNNEICTIYHGGNFIGGGSTNCIQASMGASNAIIGGYNNKVTAGSRTSIIGGGYITANASNYTYVPNLCNLNGGTSDCRLKESISNIPYGLSHVSQLEPVSYKFKSDESKATKYGFLAQCVQEIMPDLITNHPTSLVDGTPVLQFDKDAIWSSMVNAIKDLKNEVDALKARIDILEA